LEQSAPASADGCRNFLSARALRTETTINNTYDFGIGERLHNLPKLREIGFAANV
jgi:hypothetical protein